MAGNIEQVYIDSSLGYYRDLIAEYTLLDNLFESSVCYPYEIIGKFADRSGFFKRNGKLKKEKAAY